MPSTYEQWASAGLRPQQSTGLDDGAAQILESLGLQPWDSLTPAQATAQYQQLSEILRRQQQAATLMDRLDEASKDYLNSTPYGELDDDWRTLVDAYNQSATALPAVQGALAEGAEFLPTANSGRQGILTSLYNNFTGRAPTTRPPATPAQDLDFTSSLDEGMGTSVNPLSGGTGATPASSPDGLIYIGGIGYTPEQYNRMLEAGISQSEADLEYTRARTADLTGSDENLTVSERMLRNMQPFYEMQQLPWAAQDRAEEQRRYQAEQAAAASARAYAQWIQRKQLEASMAAQVGGLQQDAWRFVAQNALPAGTGQVPGFGPDSRLAQVLGPSYQGLPTVTLDTPSPTVPYQWAAQYLGGR